MKSIKTKITVALLIITVIYTLVLSLNLLGLNQINTSYQDVIDRRLVIQNNMQEVLVQSKSQMLAVRGSLITNELNNEEQFEQATNRIDEILAETIPLVKMADSLDTLDQISNLNAQMKQEFENLQVLNNLSDDEATAYWLENLLPIGSSLSSLAEEFAKYTVTVMFEEAEKNQQQAQNITTYAIIVAIIVFIAVIAFSLFISHSIANPIVRVTEATKVMAEGDLTSEAVELKTKDELRTLANSFNDMVTNTRHTLQNVLSGAEQVAAASEELIASSEEIGRSSEQVTLSIQDIARGAKTQEAHLTDNKRALEEMTIGVTRVAEATSHVSEMSEQALHLSQSGRKAVTGVVQQMNQIEYSTNETAEVITNLEKRSAEIASIVGVITDISDQTNLLALNASIEAARAGEHGKGFAVVADEVKKLATQSKQSADHIATLIGEIQNDTSKAVTSMQKGTEDVAAGLKVVAIAGDGFTNITTSVESIAKEIMEITAVSEQLSAGAQQLLASMEQILSISQDTSMNSENVVAASEEQLAIMQEVNVSIEDLAKLAETLQQQVSTFKL